MNYFRNYILCIILFITTIPTFVGCTSSNDINTIRKNNSDTIKVLAIGNSFSEDGIQYIYDLAKAANKKIIIGNIYYAGCSLAQHWSFVKNELPVYIYQKNINGGFTYYFDSTLLKGLLDENWDLITFQQYSGGSGLINTYFPYLDSLFVYVKTKCRNPNAKFAMHQTWAYPNNSSNIAFLNYFKDQKVMYKKIVTCVDSAACKEGIKIIIPSGTAIQNARTYWGDNLNRDDLHLSIPLGRYIASCAWFETIFDTTSVGNIYKPKDVSADDALKAQEAAHNAIIRPNSVIDMSQLH